MGIIAESAAAVFVGFCVSLDDSYCLLHVSFRPLFAQVQLKFSINTGVKRRRRKTLKNDFLRHLFASPVFIKLQSFDNVFALPCSQYDVKVCIEVHYFICYMCLNTFHILFQGLKRCSFRCLRGRKTSEIYKCLSHPILVITY